MPAPRIAVVVLHYGKADLAKRVTAQLAKSDPKFAEHVLVLDNAAPEQYPSPWRRTGQNLYWAGALQYALQETEALGYTHCWFLNNDILFASSPPYITRAAGRLARLEKTIGRIGVYAPSVLSNPYHPQMVQDDRYQYRLVPYVDGIAPLINIECWREIGGVDIGNNAYGYGVETWFSLSAHRAGWKVVVDHQVAIKHVYHSTARKVEGFMEKAARAEAEYMTERLGPDYRRVIDELKVQYTDETQF